MALCFQAKADLADRLGLFNKKIATEEILSQAVRPALVAVEVPYCVEDVESGLKYGRNGEAHFNVVTFLGCRTDLGLILPAVAARPWTHDAAYDKYRSDERYRPVLTADTLTGSFSPDSILICMSLPEGEPALNVSDSVSSSFGCIVWAREKKGEDGGEMLELTVKRENLGFEEGSTPVAAPGNDDSYIGGVYLTGRVKGVGIVEFVLSGLATPDEDGWKVNPVGPLTFIPGEPALPELQEAPEFHQPAVDPELTPANNI